MSPVAIALTRPRAWPQHLALIFLGALLLSALAQISIRLPFTPVPVTGQTFGVYLIALSLGRRHAIASLLSYFAMGASGLPVFALGASGWALEPTLGYKVGFLIAAWWIGGLADRGFITSFFRAWLITVSGSLAIFTCGLIVLSFFVPLESLLIAGVLPFLPGDLIKTLAAASIVTGLQNTKGHR